MRWLERAPVAGPALARDEAAYVQLEDARLRCERLRLHADSRGRRDLLHTVHRDLGMAGFFVSSNLEGARRRAALAVARERSAATLGRGDDDVDALQAVSRRALNAVEHAFSAPGLCDHVHLAHLYLLAALESLSTAAGIVSSGGERALANPPVF
jgi:hypothetical protein